MENCMDRYLGQILDNRYEILEVIGSGGMAVVYKALCHRLNRYVAIKVLKDEFACDSEFREHFRAESQAVAMLSHPNIVSVYDFSRDSDCQYIVMELLEGITLKQYMQKKGVLSWKEALHFATQIARALSHAHSKGIVHRDIKPQNIMVVKDGNIKVADFGIAHLQNESSAEMPETMGSIHYISPEQVHGDPVDARADIYSLGVVMYEMLTGKLPYEGDTVEAIAVQHFGQMLTLPGDIKPDIPVQLENITLKAMAAELSERYQSADELLNDLELFRKNQALLGMDPNSSEPDEPEGSSKKPRSRVRESYAHRKARSRTVSTFSGFALIALFLLAVVSFLWHFWLEDIFIDSERINIPNFVGEDIESVTNSDAYKDTFDFHVVYAIDPSTPEGKVISQDPEAGRSIAVDDGIDIELTVSTGIKMTTMPDMTNHEYREAKLSLEQLGFVVEIAIVASDSITEGYVVDTNPAANEQVAQGATVTLSVSGGPELKQVTMPNLLGKGKNSAISKLSELNLDVGSISEVEDAAAVGTVIWQSIDYGESVAEHTVIYLKVSKGPKETPTPTPSEPAETPADSSGETTA
ncbi:MAG: Stk1 family PASTA domain-containing Ser/Thr kinase [Oscillospiraceae bacterium]|nr:Stk1 family PASTA domain-containing Ser/Thr kinase [Oscillospiraceae bacterium]